MIHLLLMIFVSLAQASICDSPVAQKQNYWKDLVSKDIEDKISGHQIEGVHKEIYTNLMITLSYLNLMESKNETVMFLGHVYANASHHLGRLVRYHYWEKSPQHPLAKKDRGLVSGKILESAVRYFPLNLSQKLMNHSLDLYKNLSWSLTAAHHCGLGFVLKMPELDPQLKAAFAQESVDAYIKAFIVYEQSYLQTSMYALPEIGLPTMLGVLDKMRFIPFEGKKSLSFFDWCALTRCKRTSKDLEMRIRFDQMVISEELKLSALDPKTLKSRNQRAEIKEVMGLIIKDYCQQGLLNRCP